MGVFIKNIIIDVVIIMSHCPHECLVIVFVIIAVVIVIANMITCIIRIVIVIIVMIFVVVIITNIIAIYIIMIIIIMVVFVEKNDNQTVIIRSPSPSFFLIATYSHNRHYFHLAALSIIIRGVTWY